jgi:O-succinylbenzoate synthase
VRIQSVTLYKLTLPLTAAFETASHRKRQMTHIVVEAVDEDGIVGYGEVSCEAAPFYGAETVQTCWHMLTEFFVPAVLDVEWAHPAEVAALLERYRGNAFAKAGVDMVAWDLFAKARGMSLATALGATRPAVRSGVSLGIGETEQDTVGEALRVAAAGHGRVKLKIRPGMAEPVVSAVRDALGDDAIELAVDANGSFTEAHMPELERLDAYGLSLIEQPFAADEWLLHRELTRRIDTAVCLDESIATLGDAQLAIAVQACNVINIKVSRLGGLTAAVAVHDACGDAGVPVWCGGMHEFGIGRAVNVALAALPGFALPGDLSGSDERYPVDVVEPPITVAAGHIAVPTGPGIGHEVLKSRLRSMAAEAWNLDAARRMPAGSAGDAR